MRVEALKSTQKRNAKIRQRSWVPPLFVVSEADRKNWGGFHTYRDSTAKIVCDKAAPTTWEPGVPIRVTPIETPFLRHARRILGL
jgi:hypothetical protein